MKYEKNDFLPARRTRARTTMDNGETSNVKNNTMLKNCTYTRRLSFRYRSKKGLYGDYIYRRNTNNIQDRPGKRGTLLLVLLIPFSKFIGERSGKLYDEETMVSVVRAGLTLSRYRAVVPRTRNKRCVSFMSA